VRVPDEELPQLLSLLSHELRSPVGVIRGYLRMLEQYGGLNEQQQRAITAALKASDRLVAVLDQTSKFAQLRRDGRAVETVVVSIDEVLHAAADAVILPDEPPITLARGDFAAIPVRADEQLLRGTLAGLIAAVAKAQPAATTIVLECREHVSTARQGVAIRIRTPATTPVEQDVDVARGGVGLDLPLALTLLAAHDGDIREIKDGKRLAGFAVWMPSAS
jgi:signal transduction histidine kinase